MLGLDFNDRVESEMLNLPFSFYSIDTKHISYRAPIHWHRSFELVRIISGSLTIFFDFEKIEFFPGDIIIINQRVMHGFSPNNCLYEVIDFDVEKLIYQLRFVSQSIKLFVGEHIRISPVNPQKGSLLYNACERLFTTAENDYEELIILGTLLELIGIICSKHYYTENNNSSINKSVELIKPIINYIHKSYMDNLSLKQLANAGAISVSYMSSLFRNILHQTPMEYLTSYRIERACILLESSNMSVTEVAYNCGFNDSGYFVKVFKKHTGTTPKKYRSATK